MRWPIRNQIFVPFASLFLVTVAVLAVAAALLGASRSGEQRVSQIRQVVETLGDSTFPYTETVLQKMKGLSGANYIAVGAGGDIVASTLEGTISSTDLPDRVASDPRLEKLTALPVATINERRYFVAAVSGSGRNGVQILYVLYPEQTWYQARWDAAWPPLAVGVITLAVILLFSGFLAQRIALRIHAVQGLFARLAVGEFVHVQPTGPHDEVRQLVESANTLSDQLSTMRQQICHTERLRLLAQLAGGLAHQLRNAVTGAKMAVQLHQRRCQGPVGEQALLVALRQLKLTEEQIKSLLSLAKAQPGDCSTSITLADLLDEVSTLVQPACEHARVRFGAPELNAAERQVRITGADEMKAALLNLVLNAIEAAGVEGAVRLEVAIDDDELQVRIIDSGSGPPEMSGSIFDPFVSSKQEGVGLGLTLAQSAAQTRGGDLSWRRTGQETVFILTLPLDATTGKSALAPEAVTEVAATSSPSPAGPANAMTWRAG